MLRVGWLSGQLSSSGPMPNTSFNIEVSVTDRLDLISHKFYGTREHWWIIAAANNLGKGTLNIQEGGVLRLPADPSTFTNKASGY